MLSPILEVMLDVFILPTLIIIAVICMFIREWRRYRIEKRKLDRMREQNEKRGTV